jgi:hypothetical protein
MVYPETHRQLQRESAASPAGRRHGASALTFPNVEAWHVYVTYKEGDSYD